jgi:hypothetical protein
MLGLLAVKPEKRRRNRQGETACATTHINSLRTGWDDIIALI